jgi:hypothetical protein
VNSSSSACHQTFPFAASMSQRTPAAASSEIRGASWADIPSANAGGTVTYTVYANNTCAEARETPRACDDRRQVPTGSPAPGQVAQLLHSRLDLGQGERSQGGDEVETRADGRRGLINAATAAGQAGGDGSRPRSRRRISASGCLRNHTCLPSNTRAGSCLPAGVTPLPRPGPVPADDPRNSASPVAHGY